MRFYEVKPSDYEIIENILKNEIESFGVNGSADMWLIKSFIRYGKLYVLLDDENNLLSVAQFQAILGERKVFLYGLSTVKNQRTKGYASELLSETEKSLRKIGIEEILLTVAPENKEAISLYKKLNYIKIDYLKDEYGKNIDRIVMKKNIY